MTEQSATPASVAAAQPSSQVEEAVAAMAGMRTSTPTPPTPPRSPPSASSAKRPQEQQSPPLSSRAPRAGTPPVVGSLSPSSPPPGRASFKTPSRPSASSTSAGPFGRPPPTGTAGPLTFRDVGSLGPGVAARRPAPIAMHELTPVMRNTSEADLGFDDDDFAHHHHHVVSPDGNADGGGSGADGRGGGGRRGSDASRRRREQFLTLSVPGSGGCGRAGGGPGGGLPGQLQQRPRRPLPQASPAVGRGGVDDGAVLRLEVPIPPRSSPPCSSSGLGGAPATPFLRMDDVTAGDGGILTPPPVPPERPVAVRSNSAGNLDMHSMVKTIREHLKNKQKEGGVDEDQGQGQDQDQGDSVVWGQQHEGPPGQPGIFPESQAPAMGPLDGSSPCSLRDGAFRLSAPAAIHDAAPQAGLPPPTSVMHPQLPRHPNPSSDTLREPYQPIRENSFEVGVRRVGADELNSIFQRGLTPRSANGAVSSGGGGGSRPPLQPAKDGGFDDDDDDDDEHPHHLPIPLAERDWSIPSIRLANRLQGGSSVFSASYASYTCSEDDYTQEDNIVRDGNYDDDVEDVEDDEATISTAGSIEAHHQDRPTVVGIGEVGRLAAEPSAPWDVVIEGKVSDVVAVVDPPHRPEDDPSASDKAVGALSASALSGELRSDAAAAAAAPVLFRGGRPEERNFVPSVEEEAAADAASPADSSGRRRKRKMDKAEKEKEAIEWLRTVEVGGISEAASSKFLTGANKAAAVAAGSNVLQPHPLNRVISSPAACVSKSGIV